MAKTNFKKKTKADKSRNTKSSYGRGKKGSNHQPSLSKPRPNTINLNTNSLKSLKSPSGKFIEASGAQTEHFKETLFGGSKLSELQLKYQKKMMSARFRTINEKLYNNRGEDSYAEFQRDPSLFDIYHSGYREQVKAWPENPLDIIIKWIKKSHQNAIIADMGCGDAKLAESLDGNTVHSFDLISKNARVISADIAHVPLADNSVDIVVFSLSLMGTNIGEFLEEASRILKPNGILKIAEVRSRFEGQEDGIEEFFNVINQAGFHITERNFNNKMFFVIECLKAGKKKRVDHGYSAKPCLYKRR